MSSSFGPVNWKHAKFGECLYCYDEKWCRQQHMFLEARTHLVGPVCKHRLPPPKHHYMQPAINAMREERVSSPIKHWEKDLGIEKRGYWSRRALLPEYCGEFGELSDLRLAGLHNLDDEEAEAAVASVLSCTQQTRT